jgi:hypothetical protein
LIEGGFIAGPPSSIDRLYPEGQRSADRSTLLLVEAGQTGGHCRPCLLRNRSIEYLLGCVVEIAKAFYLEAIGDDRK